MFREIGERLPKLKLGSVKLWEEVKGRNRQSRKRMSDAIFLTKRVSGPSKIGDNRELDKAACGRLFARSVGALEVVRIARSRSGL